MADTTRIPTRKEIPAAHTWDLSKLYKDETAWAADMAAYESKIGEAEAYKGSLGASANRFFEALSFYRDVLLLEERVGHWAMLRQTEDEGDSSARGRVGRFTMAATKGAGAWSFFTPELLSLDENAVRAWLKEERFAEYRVFVERILRQKPHVLSEAEERILALGQDAAATPNEAFSVLTNVDMDFGTVDTPDGPKPLTQSTFGSLMRDPDRLVREKAYKAFYAEFSAHKNTLAQLYSGQCKRDYFQATVRKFKGYREMALYPDNVPESVYDNLVATVNKNLPVLHDYYRLRAQVLGLPELRHWDVYAPLVGSVTVRHSWEEAVDAIEKALSPLGQEYVGVLCSGLRGRWADRYENEGKQAGAFSWGSFTSDPYILMNYKDDVLADVFTLAHEGGHSMHSWYSSKANPFMQYGYTIFEAEVASTFNEALLFHYMAERADSPELKAYLLSSRIDDILGTLFRQTMFAEYEHRAHALMEGGQSLTLDLLRSEYRALLAKYFGPAMRLEEESDLEGLRIPHFYRPYYVYKYATGISASIALSRRVLGGEKGARDDYFAFLSSGGSRFPIEALKVAGVDMTGPGPVEAACAEFGGLVAQLRVALKL